MRVKEKTVALLPKDAKAAPGGGPDLTDGRRQRSERSRQQIVAAMLELVRGGEMHPSAAQVAEASGVSLRTVFRHFEEMDTLSREMSATVEAEILPIVLAPFEAPTWRGRLEEMIARRANVYERILPLKVAGSVRRFQSSFLMDDYRRFLTLERSVLLGILPKSVTSNAPAFAALEMTTGFPAWRRLRQDQGLSPKDAERAMRFAVDKLMAGF